MQFFRLFANFMEEDYFSLLFFIAFGILAGGFGHRYGLWERDCIGAGVVFSRLPEGDQPVDPALEVGGLKGLEIHEVSNVHPVPQSRLA